MVARRPKVAQPQPPRMSVDEQRLARLWHAEDGLGPTEIGARLRRSAGSISRLLAVGPGDKNAVGRPVSKNLNSAGCRARGNPAAKSLSLYRCMHLRMLCNHAVYMSRIID